jgi:thioesterase domain-containing protein
VGGHVFTFHKFARLIGAEQPVYGVKAIGVDGARQPPDSFEAIAAEYVQEITALRPQGPYLLSGYSLGAVVAYELAVQLRALGHQVPLLIAFDMYAPGYPKPLPFARRVLAHASAFAGLSWREKKNYLGQRFRNVKERMLGKVGRTLLQVPIVRSRPESRIAKVFSGIGMRLVQAPAIEGAGDLPQEALQKVWLALNMAHTKYRPTRTLDGRIVLIKSQEGFRWAATSFDDPMLGWADWGVGGLEHQTVPGGHMDLFSDEHIERVAAGVRECIARALQDRSP